MRANRDAAVGASAQVAGAVAPGPWRRGRGGRGAGAPPAVAPVPGPGRGQDAGVGERPARGSVIAPTTVTEAASSATIAPASQCSWLTPRARALLTEWSAMHG